MGRQRHRAPADGVVASFSCSVDCTGSTSLVQGLCLEKNVPLIDVPDNKSLGEWAGLCKIDKDGLPRKVVGASCVCVTDFGEEGEAYNYMMNHLGKA
ncbi:unnamed protein product [Polarella glacialis]|uniref:40S ribosomal protein S12 n=1 Tax=Polarella glacialis TaxID=89957 RepID=A0A813KIC7_POLGL|nr:unnamed protein product [Polarella glacialis]